METGSGQESASATAQHGQLSDRPVEAQRPPRSVANEAPEDPAGFTTPTWPASPPPSGYATPAVAVTALAADAQWQSTLSSPHGSQASQASHPGFTVHVAAATSTSMSAGSHILSSWPTYTAVYLTCGTDISDACLPNPSLPALPNELLLHILGYLDVCDLLATSRANHRLRTLSLAPILHQYRLQRTRLVLPPLLSPVNRPSLSDLVTRSIFLTSTSVVSRKLARSLVSIRLSRRLATRPSPEALVQRCVLPPECVPGMTGLHVMPALVARRKAIEKEKVKDGLRRWIGAKWRGEVRERQEHVRRWEEVRGVGRVWRLTRFWERIGRGEQLVIR